MRAANVADFNDETSLFYRGTAFVGGRLFPNGPVSLRLILGAGAQYETYEQIQLIDGISLSETDRFSFRPEARLTVHWDVWRGILGLRLRVRGTRFSITRNDGVLRLDTLGGISSMGTTVVTDQTELSGRLFVELDVADFIGFVPALFVGAEHVSISGPDERTSTWVPLVGVGLFRVGDLR